MEEHIYVATEEVIARATTFIRENTPKETTKTFRVPPVMIAALARCGKTTTLKLIFNHLLALKESFVPIFVTFNRDSGFKRDESKSDVENFLRGVITQLVPDAFAKEEEKKNTIFSREDLNSYLNTAPGPVVLLVDELNALGPLSADLSSLLREMFLDPKNRYLCFTSHWMVNLSEGLSPRGTCFVPVACMMDVGALKAIVPQITSAETTLFAGLPGLIYCVKVMRPGFDPHAYFTAEVYPAVGHFLRQFCTGDDIQEMREFSRYTYRDQHGKVVWPLCYAEPFLNSAKQNQVSSLISITDVRNANGLRRDNNGLGLEWEYTARIALGMVALAATLRPLTSGERKVTGDTEPNPELVIYILDKEIETLEQAQTFIEVSSKGALARKEGPVLILAFPTFRSFPLFDGIIRYVSKYQQYWRGVQTKPGRELPTEDCPADFEMGVLLRGDRKAQHPTKKKLKGWVYLNLDEITSWLPYSMRSLLPHTWRSPSQKTMKRKRNKQNKRKRSFAGIPAEKN